MTSDEALGEAQAAAPLLEDRVRYHTKNFGSRGRAAVARLYPDRVEVTDRGGGPVATIVLADVTEARSSALGLIRLYVGPQMHILDMQRMRFAVFGLVGALIAGATAPARGWAATLEQLGVPIGRKRP